MLVKYDDDKPMLMVLQDKLMSEFAATLRNYVHDQVYSLHQTIAGLPDGCVIVPFAFMHAAEYSEKFDDLMATFTEFQSSCAAARRFWKTNQPERRKGDRRKP